MQNSALLATLMHFALVVIVIVIIIITLIIIIIIAVIITIGHRDMFASHAALKPSSS